MADRWASTPLNESLGQQEDVSMSSNPRVPYEMASDRRRLPPPQPGKPLIVHVIVEYWPFDQPMPRKLIPGPHGNEKVPDVPNFSWVEYGMRTGFPRILDALKRRKLPASTTINASVIDVYPRVGKARVALARKLAVILHSVWRSGVPFRWADPVVT
jgi:hypothetical protein